MPRKRNRQKFFAFLKETAGGTVAEFALILPVLILLTLGAINMSLLLYTESMLHFAVQDAARCATVKTTVCTSLTTLRTYAAKNYGGMTATPTFAWTTPACGNFVTATVNYNLTLGLASIPIPLTAEACYPLA